MSHVARLTTKIRDLSALRTAAERLGLTWNQGQETYRWYGRHVGDYPMPDGFTAEDLGRCAHAISVPGKPGAYEVGVVRSPDGDGWTLLYDFWSGGKGLMKVIGKDACHLVQEYAVAAVENATAGQWTVDRESVDTETGTLRLRLTR